MILAATLTGTLQFVLGGILIFLSLVLMVLILFQSSKDKSLSGTITGGSETFFGKSKGVADRDKLLSKLTVVVAIITVVVTIALVVIINTLSI